MWDGLGMVLEWPLGVALGWPWGWWPPPAASLGNNLLTNEVVSSGQTASGQTTAASLFCARTRLVLR